MDLQGSINNDAEKKMFFDWLCRILTASKQYLMDHQDKEEFKKVLKFPDALSSEFEGEVVITVRRKHEFRH